MVLKHILNEVVTTQRDKTLKQMTQLRNQRLTKAAATIFIITISDTIALLPYSLYTSLKLLVPNHIPNVSEDLYNGFTVLMFMNVVLHPLVCMTVNTKLRNLIMSIGKSGSVIFP